MNLSELYDVLDRVWANPTFYEATDATFRVTYVSERSGNELTREFRIFPVLPEYRDQYYGEGGVRYMRLKSNEKSDVTVRWVKPDNRRDGDETKPSMAFESVRDTPKVVGFEVVTGEEGR